MFAVIETGGKQYKVSVGDKLKLEKLAAREGDTFSFDKVLLESDGGEVVIGEPSIPSALVSGKILRHGRAAKKIIFRFKPKTRHRVKRGYRQEYTEVEITDIK